MNCPKCRTSVLRRPSTSTSPWFAEPLRCPNCAGLWFEAKALSALGSEWTEPPSDDIDPPPLSGDGRAGLCPHGHGLLRRAAVANLGFSLERCGSCHGIWFDAGEWTRLAEHRLQETLPLFWSESWQRRQRSEQSERAHRDWAEQALGPELVAKLNDLAERLKGHPRRSEALGYLQIVSRSSSPAGVSSVHRDPAASDAEEPSAERD